MQKKALLAACSYFSGKKQLCSNILWDIEVTAKINRLAYQKSLYWKNSMYT